MSAKNTLAIQRCELSRKELDEFLSFYPIPSEYRVILPTSTQTILDAPPGYIGLYTHCFSLANLRLPLNDFFCEVLQYFKVHISRFNPFGCSKLTTFIVMCKAYDYEPSVELFSGFFNLCKAGWHQRLFIIQDTIVHSKFSQLLLKENMLDVKSLKDKLPSGIEQNPKFQRLGRYPFSACAFDDPILFLSGLQSSWEHGQQNFIYTEEDEDLTFLPKDLSPGFNTGSPFVSINTEPVRTDEELAVEPATELVNERVGTTADSGGVPKEILLLKLAFGLSTSRTVRAKASVMKDDTHVLSISDDDDEGENISQEDLKLKFLRSLPSEWNTHVVIWKNKPNLDTRSFDDLYNDFKIVKQEVKGTSQFVYEDLEQIYEDELKEMDLKWQLALLSMRTRRFFQKTGRKITINGSDTAGYDKSKIEIRRNSSKAMVAIDGAGFDWSYMADDEVPTNMALMASFQTLSTLITKLCSKDLSKKAIETLKTQLDNLRIEFNTSEFNLATYKRGLASVEEQLVFYKKNEPEFEGYGPKTSKSVSENTSNEVRESPTAPLVKEFVSDDKLEKNTIFLLSQTPRLTAITIKRKGWQKAVNTARPNSAVVNAVRENQVSAVKASACWLIPTKLKGINYF
ncbi:hypothetical protein Tco_1492027 [Tanacetum coccineum]